METLITRVDSAGVVKGEANVLAEYIRENKDLHENENNVIIAHPLLSRGQKKGFLKTRVKLKK